MTRHPVVQLWHKGQLVAEAPFVDERVRIGRMKQNELVVPNLAVSRFHAVLHCGASGLELEDLGSENGSFLNGERVSGRVPVGLDDVVRIGKHELRLRAAAAEPAPAAAPEPAAPAQAVATPPVAAPEAAEAPAPSTSALFDFGRDADLATSDADLGAALDPALDDVEAAALAMSFDAEADLPAMATPPAAAAPAEPVAPPAAAALAPPAMEPGRDGESLFDAEADGEPLELGSAGLVPGDAFPGETPDGLDASEADAELPSDVLGEAPGAPDPGPADAGASAPSGEPARALHAGLIVQREGRIERVFAWDAERLCAGRGVDCEIPLGAAVVSRRHALFVREGSRHEVRDLDSVAGVTVNGERTLARVLEVGDVVRIGEFELTFVLDPLPIAPFTAPPPADAGPAADPAARTYRDQRAETVPPLAVSAPTGEFLTDPMPEIDLLSEADPVDEEKPEDEALAVYREPRAVEASASRQVEAALLSSPTLAVVPGVGAETLRLELTLERSALPPELQELLERLGEGEVRLPVELRIAGRSGEGDGPDAAD